MSLVYEFSNYRLRTKSKTKSIIFIMYNKEVLTLLNKCSICEKK